MGSFERRSAGKCSRDGCKKCNLRCNLHYLHQGNLKFVIYLLTCTPPTFFRNPRRGTTRTPCSSDSAENVTVYINFTYQCTKVHRFSVMLNIDSQTHDK